MLVEVALNLVEKPHQDDGAIIDWRPAKGVYITPSEMADWFGGTEPTAKLDAIGRVRRAKFRMLVRKAVYWTNPKLDRALAARARWSQNGKGNWSDLPKRVQDHHIEIASSTVENQGRWIEYRVTDGLHEFWGDGELKAFGIAVMDLSARAIFEIGEQPIAEEVTPPYHEMVAPKKRAYKVDYASLLSPESVVKWRDKDKLVVPASLGKAWEDTRAWGERAVELVTMPRVSPNGQVI